MIYCLVKFGPCSKGGKEKAENIVADYLSSLLNNWQIIDRYYLTWMGGILHSHLFLSRPDSLSRQFHSEWGKKNIEKVSTYFNREPELIIKDDDIKKRYARWESSEYLYLRTHAFENCSPLFRGNDGTSIPLYLIPITDQEREYIRFLAEAYSHHDNIWIGSGELEIQAYKQIADPKSELMKAALEHCDNIEKATGKPTYCYLMRYYGRKKNEENRLCPLCGKNWSTGLSSIGAQNFWQFHFRCDDCRLVSHIADTDEDERHARIGEYREKRIKKTEQKH
jgi:predicted  nucleic acid-binding Zn ribbon protein